MPLFFQNRRPGECAFCTYLTHFHHCPLTHSHHCPNHMLASNQKTSFPESFAQQNTNRKQTQENNKSNPRDPILLTFIILFFFVVSFFFLVMAGGTHVIALRQPALFEPSAQMESEESPMWASR